MKKRTDELYIHECGHKKSRNVHTLFSPIKVIGFKYQNLYQRVLTTTTLAVHTQTSQ
jgi:hypothetical protein